MPNPRRGPLARSEFAALLDTAGADCSVPVPDVPESSDEPVPEPVPDPDPDPEFDPVLVGVASDTLLEVIRVGTALLVDDTTVEGPTNNGTSACYPWLA
jgi:hypothetical protein